MGRVGEIGAQFCAWEAIPDQASETVGSFARGDFVTLCCTGPRQQPDEMDQPDLQQSQ